MRRLTKPVGLAACLCLLALQWSDLHVHSDAGGILGTPESAHSHSHSHDRVQHGRPGDHARKHPGDPQDYRDARDVPLTNPALAPIKTPLAILALVFLFAVLPRVGTPISADVVYPVLSGRHTRWRPPLRAPPLTA